MQRQLFLLIFVILIGNTFSLAQNNYVIVIHGGAGVMSREKMNDELQAKYKAKLIDALTFGENMLKEGASATDVVVKVINVMKDSPLFNAGKGAVFTHDGFNELDASIMEGKTMNAGAVAGVRDIKNPINAARAVMGYKNLSIA